MGTLSLLETNNVTKKARQNHAKGNKIKLDYAFQPMIKVVSSSISSFALHKNLLA
jgi:hypothetical protein